MDVAAASRDSGALDGMGGGVKTGEQLNQPVCSRGQHPRRDGCPYRMTTGRYVRCARLSVYAAGDEGVNALPNVRRRLIRRCASGRLGYRQQVALERMATEAAPSLTLSFT
jgi:hypothetical protein